MKSSNIEFRSHEVRNILTALSMAVLFVAVLAAPGAAMAVDFGGSDTKVEGFFKSIQGLLTIASISVVTIAVIFAGYQIAFAHKRIADVAPILIGGFLIGAATQIASMLLGPGDGSAPTGMALLLGALSSLPYA